MLILLLQYLKSIKKLIKININTAIDKKTTPIIAPGWRPFTFIILSSWFSSGLGEGIFFGGQVKVRLALH